MPMHSFLLVTGMVYPSFGVVYGMSQIVMLSSKATDTYLATGIKGFSQPDRRAERHDGDRVALWFVLIRI
jgi:hypothetical protein